MTQEQYNKASECIAEIQRLKRFREQVQNCRADFEKEFPIQAENWRKSIMEQIDNEIKAVEFLFSQL